MRTLDTLPYLISAPLSTLEMVSPMPSFISTDVGTLLPVAIAFPKWSYPNEAVPSVVFTKSLYSNMASVPSKDL